MRGSRTALEERWSSNGTKWRKGEIGCHWIGGDGAVAAAMVIQVVACPWHCKAAIPATQRTEEGGTFSGLSVVVLASESGLGLSPG
jgi:hypothetical protein